MRNGHPEQRRNNALRYLDQSWRRKNQDELILFGRVAAKSGPAEEVTQSPAGACRLWLGPREPGKGRPALPGTLNQETYVRVFLPVRTVEPGGKD